MKVSFVTSGFSDGFTDIFITELKKYLVSYKSFVFIASDFREHEKTQRYFDEFLSMFQVYKIVFEKAYIIDYKITPDKAKALVKSADVVWLAGGDTLKQIAYIREYGIIPSLLERDGITIGMSAGSINMARHVVLAKDITDNVAELSLYDGIGLTDFNIEPHINEASVEHIADIEEAAKTAQIYGLYDESFIEAVDGKITIFGKCILFNGRNSNADA